MERRPAKVGPKLKVKVPQFRRTDFAEDIQTLGALAQSLTSQPTSCKSLLLDLARGNTIGKKVGEETNANEEQDKETRLIEAPFQLRTNNAAPLQFPKGPAEADALTLDQQLAAGKNKSDATSVKGSSQSVELPTEKQKHLGPKDAVDEPDLARGEVPQEGQVIIGQWLEDIHKRELHTNPSKGNSNIAPARRLLAQSQQDGSTLSVADLLQRNVPTLVTGPPASSKQAKAASSTAVQADHGFGRPPPFPTGSLPQGPQYNLEQVELPPGGAAEGLPLELFDDPDTFEDRRPEEWVEFCAAERAQRKAAAEGPDALLEGSPRAEGDGSPGAASRDREEGEEDRPASPWEAGEEEALMFQAATLDGAEGRDAAIELLSRQWKRSSMSRKGRRQREDQEGGKEGEGEAEEGEETEGEADGPEGEREAEEDYHDWDADVLHYTGKQWGLVPARVISWDSRMRRFIVVTESGREKAVRRLAVRFRAEDPRKFRHRVEASKARKARIEEQQRFIEFVESQPDQAVSPMRRSLKETFIRHCLHHSHVQDPQNYVLSIRQLLIDVEQNYIISSKLERVKLAMIQKHGTRDALIHPYTMKANPFAKLLIPFLPPPVPFFGLCDVFPLYRDGYGSAALHWRNMPVVERRDQIAGALSFSKERLRSLTNQVQKKFEEVRDLRLLDVSDLPSFQVVEQGEDENEGDGDGEGGGPSLVKSLGAIPDSAFATLSSGGPFLAQKRLKRAKPFDPSEFLEKQEAHRGAVTKALEKQWRESVLSEVVDVLSEEFNFFTDDHAKHMRSPLHRYLRKLDLMLNRHLREFISDSIGSWTHFIEAFAPDPSNSRPLAAPLLVLKIQESEGTLEINPEPKKLLEALLDLLDGIVISCNTLMSAEPELLPFCSLDSTVLYPLTSSHGPLVDAKKRLADVVNDCLRAPADLLAKFKEFEYLLSQTVRMVTTPEAERGEKPPEQPELKETEDTEATQAADEATKESEGGEAQDTVTEGVTADGTGVPSAAEGGTASEQLDPMKAPVLLVDVIDIQKTRQQLMALKDARDQIQAVSSSLVTLPLFQIDAEAALEALDAAVVARSNEVLQALEDSIYRRSLFILEKWQDAHERVIRPPKDEEELRELKNFLASIKQSLEEPLMAMTKHVHQQINLASSFSFAVSDEAVEAAFRSFSWPLELRINVSNTTQNLEAEKEKFMDKLQAEKEAFKQEIAGIQEFIDSIKKNASWDEAKRLHGPLLKYQSDIEKAKEKVLSFQQRERLFNVDVTDFSHLDEMVEEYKPYNKLWMTAAEFGVNAEDWLNMNLQKLPATEVEESIETWYKEAIKMAREFAKINQPIPQKVAEDLKEAIDRYRGHLPIIRALCQEALQKRHWDELFARMEKEAETDHDQLTLYTLLNMEADKHIDLIEEISAVAQKEFGLKKTLKQMKEEWKGCELEASPYKETGTYLLKGVDDVQALLDEHIVKTQAIRGSPFVKPIEKEVKEWEQRLLHIQDLFEVWMNVQRAWLYLEPIFGSEDIKRQMPMEARRFEQIDGLWRSTMDQVKESPAALDVADIDSVLPHFQQAAKKLEDIQKSLNDYLETKRLAFPRFFFLSNDELLSILSQTKDPVAVQPHMNKCFEGVNKVRFDAATGSSIIEGMISAEGEEVTLTVTPGDPPSGGKSLVVDVNADDKKGNVEKWLLEFEGSMRDVLRAQIDASVTAYAKEQRTKWCLEWPGQVVLAVDCIYWTAEVAEAISSGAIDKYVQKLVSQLSEVVQLVRGKLTKQNRKTLGAMVTIDVHARDVVMQLEKAKIGSPDEFDWMSQLRYYWKKPGEIPAPAREATGGKKQMNAKCECEVRIVNSCLHYGFEYLGNSDRLVITPLTDRCYRTLMGAFHLYYGGAPEGPAGTGKTESTKDLAKAVAVQCVVFNCSDGLDYLAMAKFFKGLAASGCWCCFDEFNRIDLEVLSVIAQQVAQIQDAIRMQKRNFLFEGTELDLVPTCAVNITMNPGYAGRSELPDNLKALFRPCAMMVPDYSLIAEIVLYSFGFEDAKNLARKCVGSLRLSSEQLSSQDHYDFGMRALKAILTAAGQLKRTLGEEFTEDILALRALSDVNLPKFTQNDIPLFKGIISDLFPGTTLPAPDYGDLTAAMENASAERNLQSTGPFIHKCTQLLETVMVRHGLMLVGRTLSGKTCVMDVLAAAMAAVAQKNPESEVYMPVEIHTMNPKSITQGQLYGQFDENTHEWTDGILALTVRYASNADPKKRQWIALDGPVDAVWIENMNTVLDDNKKLCLNSGEIIKLSPVTTMMFEVEDLAVASPATVSRCGMVFLEPDQLGWEPFVDSWLEGPVPSGTSSFGKDGVNGQQIKQHFMEFVPGALDLIHRSCNTPVPISENWLVMSALKLLTCMLLRHVPEFKAAQKAHEDASAAISGDAGKTDKKDKGDGMSQKDKDQRVESTFFFSILWSVGAAVDEAGRRLFDEFIRDFLAGKGEEMREKYNLLVDIPVYTSKTKFSIPEKLLAYDFLVQEDTGKWAPWTQGLQQLDIPKEAQIHQIIVPTSDTRRNAFFLETLSLTRCHILLSGTTGTGKTVSVQSQLSEGFDKERYTNICFAFSAQTTANQTQDIVDGKLDKRKKGTFGPPFGKTCIVFVDDLNLPAKETYGAQPPIEILRQWMASRGWYDRKTCEFRELVDLQFIACMGPPGGGRNHISMRYTRNYNLIFLTPFDNESLTRIFVTVMKWYFQPFTSAVASQVPLVVKATIELFDSAQKDLLPTPAKSHYTFNLRDLARVVQGVCMCTPDSLQSQDDMVKCWVHECSRVFADRLVSLEDKGWLQQQLRGLMDSNFRRKWEQLVGSDPKATVLFGDFVDPRRPFYQELSDREALEEAMNGYLTDYNEMNPRKQMNLVLFFSAIEHVARIIRVLRQPLGNALLVGVGGSGRKSLTMLATNIVQYDLSTIEISKAYGVSEWRDDLKNLQMKSGGKAKEVTFMISDTQLVKETFVEDLSALLNTGEIPNLFNQEDKNTILDLCMKPASQANPPRHGPAEIFQYFLEVSRMNLHIVLCLSPIGDGFRNRIRMFPSLVNCCTIDWFMEWPAEALRSVSHHFLAEEVTAGNLPSEEVLDGVAATCVEMQQSVTDLTRKYREDDRRHYYVTPTSYLELINAFKGLLKNKRDEVRGAKSRYDVGLDKLQSTSEAVVEMQKTLEELQPVLKKTSEETAALMVTIDQKQKEASQQQAKVQVEEEACSKQAAAAQAMKDECQGQLDQALPILQSAEDALKKLSKNDLVEVKAMKSPPDGVVLVMNALCIMFRVKPAKKKGPDGRSNVEDYWEPAKKELLGDAKLLQKLFGYDKDNIPADIVQKVTVFAENPAFDPELIKKASVAATGLCKWVLALIQYDKVGRSVAKIVEPKRLALAEAEATLKKAMDELAEKKAMLQEVVDRVNALISDFEKAKAKKDRLQQEDDDCRKKLVRAEKLTSGLGGERVTWTKASERLGKEFASLTGDVLVASGVIAYMGVFPAGHRQTTVAHWIDFLLNQNIQTSVSISRKAAMEAAASGASNSEALREIAFSLQSIVGDPVKIQQWVINKLPNDSFSLDNAIIMSNSRRWPLMIDPQLQANKWIKCEEGGGPQGAGGADKKGRGGGGGGDEKASAQPTLKVLRFSQDYARALEMCVSQGVPVLFENVGEHLDPLLQPLLQKAVFKMGSVMMIRLGDQQIEYSKDFRLYLTTKLPNPHYAPEVCVEVTLLNFVVTADGLEDQLLAMLVKEEEPAVEEKRVRLVVESAESKRSLKELEDKILRLLSQSK
eukprot:Cvel_23772.t1-p1 / transcript=Cvel_23772.t1 / gene=Cvel_23772 / organism=Chromera_velia_CCMP2878 / gene_product=Dynein heavy chain 7, axonemal, putative / transcript_product=Dynein heavy chain 7, axonemal, putative / location=Cvel_scaffold2493:30-23749(-) / protein_length=3778 / sequence_SO=supercontig / SO=protein_coding / is_pseudo=false